MRRAILIWGLLAIATLLPLSLALTSPLLAWRDPVYILAGLAGIIGLVLLLFQPLLVGGHLPGFHGPRGRRLHLWVGTGLVVAVLVHVAGLWITSPPDVIDALLLASPTPFSAWGVIAMWAVFAAATLAALRSRMRLRPRTWRRAHTALATITVIGTITHAMLIEGTMETVTKALLCAFVLAATLAVLIGRKVWKGRNQH